MAGKLKASSSETKLMLTAAGPGSAGAPDAVDVILGVFGEVVVNDVADALHMDAASGHVGGTR